MKKISIYDINYWIKKGFSEEDAILKVKEKQKQNSLKQDKNKKENIYLIETWIKKGFSEEDSIITISKKTIKKSRRNMGTRFIKN